MSGKKAIIFSLILVGILAALLLLKHMGVLQSWWDAILELTAPIRDVL